MIGSTRERRWRCSIRRSLPWGAGHEPALMAIVNVTPDSFSDGGRFLDPREAIAQAMRSVDEGAAIVDIGGESTRPGALPVNATLQCERVLPVIRGLREAGCDAIISIDTTSAAVAEAALDAGADLVNDTSAGEDDPAMFPLVAARRCGVVLMHRRRAPAQESWSHELSSADAASRSDRMGSPDEGRGEGVVARVRRELDARRSAAVLAGVDIEAIALDPGLGFGKSVEENFQLLARLPELASPGSPLLVGASRKSFIGAVTGEPAPAARLPGSLAAALIAAMGGAAVLRVHDVRPHRQVLSVLRWTSNPRAGDAQWQAVQP